MILKKTADTPPRNCELCGQPLQTGELLWVGAKITHYPLCPETGLLRDEEIRALLHKFGKREQ